MPLALAGSANAVMRRATTKLAVDRIGNLRCCGYSSCREYRLFSLTFASAYHKLLFTPAKGGIKYR
jgi:hypothetical protein